MNRINLTIILTMAMQACAPQMGSDVNMAGDRLAKSNDIHAPIVWNLVSLLPESAESKDALDRAHKQCVQDYVANRLSKVPPNCQIIPNCTATAVRDPQLGSKTFFLTAAHCLDGDLIGQPRAAATKGEVKVAQGSKDMFVRTDKGEVRFIKTIVWPRVFDDKEPDSFRGWADLAVFDLVDEPSFAVAATLGRAPAGPFLEGAQFKALLDRFFSGVRNPDAPWQGAFNNNIWKDSDLKRLQALDLYGFGIQEIKRERTKTVLEKTDEAACKKLKDQGDTVQWNARDGACIADDVSLAIEGPNAGKLQHSRMFAAAVDATGKAAMLLPENSREGICSGDSGGPAFSSKEPMQIIGVISRTEFGAETPCVGSPEIVEIPSGYPDLMKAMYRQLSETAAAK